MLIYVEFENSIGDVTRLKCDRSWVGAMLIDSVMISTRLKCDRSSWIRAPLSDSVMISTLPQVW